MGEFIVVGFSPGTPEFMLPHLLVKPVDVGQDGVLRMTRLPFGEYALRWDMELLEWVVD